MHSGWPYSPDGAEPSLSRFRFTEPHMGTQFQIIVYAPDKDTADKAAKDAFARIASLNGIMSDYQQTSELMRLCAKPAGRPCRSAPNCSLFYPRRKKCLANPTALST